MILKVRFLGHPVLPIAKLMVMGRQVFQQPKCIHLPPGLRRDFFVLCSSLVGFFYRPVPLHFEALIMLTKSHNYLKLQELEEDVQVENLFAEKNPETVIHSAL